MKREPPDSQIIINKYIFQGSRKTKCLDIIETVFCLQIQLDAWLKEDSSVQKVNDNNTRVHWVDCDQEFKCLLHAGIIVNTVHKNINVFFQDTLVLFEKHIRAALNEHGAI